MFISTSEATSKDGELINQTKSVSDRYIFNTAITRSQSLVVVVGNPFLLLKIEKHMLQKYGEGAECWTPYIKQCIECKTFTYSERLRKSLEVCSDFKVLLERIYSESNKIGSTGKSKGLDSIIKAYKKVFEDMPEYRDTKVTLMSTPGAHLSWNLKEENQQNEDDENSQDNIAYTDSYECILEVESIREAKAIPMDSSKKIVKIQGIGNRKGAFDGDRVTVGIFPDNPQDKCYGRILTAERDSEVQLLCRVSHANPIIFYPIDNKNPLMINLPRLSRNLIQRKNRMNIRDMIDNGLKCTDVIIFDRKSLNLDSDDITLPQIRQVIPLSVARNMVFLVSLVRWEKKYRNPLGIVVGAYPKGYTKFNAERLLKLQCAVDYNEDKPISEVDAKDAERDRNLKLYDQAFTIDPKEAQNLDDALSLVRISTDEDQLEKYELGVHIVNAAKHIIKCDDEIARSSGTSVYGGEKGKIMHMLPYETRSQLSLTPGKIRDVISVTCTVTIDRQAPTSVELSNIQIEAAQIKSAIQLTYEDAQDLLDGNISTECVNSIRKFDQDNSLSLQEAIKLLYDLSHFMRRGRLKSDAAYVYDSNEYEESLCWQSHLLVEELMIWANSEVARDIHSSYPDAAILRTQPPPNIEETRKHVDENENVLLHSLYLSRYLQTSDAQIHSADIPFVIPIDTLKKIHKALSDRNLVLLTSLLSSDQFYPQLAAVSSKFRSVLSRALYCCTEKDRNDASAYRHDSLCLDEYTHFTSPLRRYVDIEVQRMLLENWKRPRRDFKHEEHTKLCSYLNKKVSNASKFEKEIKRVKLAFDLTSSSEVHSCFICQSLKGTVELTFPQFKLKQLPIKARRLRINDLIPEKAANGSQLYSWNLQITSLSRDLAASILESSPLSIVSDSNDSSSSNISMKAFCCLNSSDSTLDTEYFKASQQSLVVELSPNNWAKALQFVRSPTKEGMDNIKKLLPVVPLLPSSCSADPINQQKAYSFLDCNIEVSLEPSSVLKVWLTWSMREPLISPAIQLVELSPLLRICVQHNSHPAECFSDPNLKQASKAVYASIEEYIDLWKAVLLAEAAEKSVKECQPMIIRDVHLQWPNLVIPKECVEEPYYVPSDDVKIVFPKSFKDQCYEFFKVNVGTLVCVRYGCDPHCSVRAVFHFVVHRIDGRDDDDKEISISVKHIGEMNCRISEDVKKMLESNRFTCEIQIILMSHSHM